MLSPNIRALVGQDRSRGKAQDNWQRLHRCFPRLCKHTEGEARCEAQVPCSGMPILFCRDNHVSLLHFPDSVHSEQSIAAVLRLTNILREDQIGMGHCSQNQVLLVINGCACAAAWRFSWCKVCMHKAACSIDIRCKPMTINNVHPRYLLHEAHTLRASDRHDTNRQNQQPS